ncbi:NAD(P)-dependent oxidoreductase [Amycolatopsis umgeniensis]|uniref:3-hydroxyisobutyrate dehydrogenase-like beta-hydroxyacid dehydrogenase n=1 Tax=Amycolatopsis umgeniensis TaxID=336628 RepID=A0A841ATK9_9PSEU|nr:NAD(P)-binding domain-containing protein [Amycolatopsis umgeniensis]MBB5849991.1 3-hydroxyisobutyrate dehydrogenase-like beta-hydroxyacid dehydrogenase [Amycolatopsis umgeniensis]
MITMIGLGPMGQAMVRVLLENGHGVTVWNRTAARADGVVAAGAVRAETVADAVSASELVLLSLTDYTAMYDILGKAEETLAGKVIVNLSSDTPEKTREAADWVKAHGGQFIAGGVMVPAPLVGKEGAYVFYSGPAEVFEKYRETLALIGRADFLGEDVRLAQLFYQAQLDIFLNSLSAFMHASALVRSAGVPLRKFVPYAKDNFAMMDFYLEASAEQIEKGDHPGDEADVIMMGASADHIVQASRDAGIDVLLPEAVKSHYDRAIAAGHGRSSWTSLFEVIKEG